MSSQSTIRLKWDQGRPPEVQARGGLLHRKYGCGRHSGGCCTACRPTGVMLRPGAVDTTAEGAAPPIVHNVLNSPGRPLESGVRASMEHRFTYDFSRVRVHTDERAAESSRAVGATAYTVGRDVVFGAGQYSPGTVEGRELLAHELTHVVQQGDRAGGPLRIGAPGTDLEREADRMAGDAVSASGLPPFPTRAARAAAATTGCR